MKKFSFIFMLIFILSTLAAAPLGVSAAANLVFLNENATLVTSSNSQLSNESNNEIFSIANMPFNSGTAPYFTAITGGNQKEDTDKYVKFTYTGTAAPYNYNTPRMRINKTVDGDTYQYETYEFDVMFGNENSSVVVGFSSDSTTNIAYCNILASSSAIQFNDKTTYATYNTCGVNKWHKVKVVARIDGIAETVKMYIDNSSTPIETGSFTTKGLPINKYACVLFPVANGATTEVYLDNFKVYLGDASDTAFSAPSITSSDEEKATISGTDITAKTNIVAELKAAFTGAEVVGVYDSTISTEINDYVEAGNVLVVKNTAGVYGYYNITSAPAVTGVNRITVSGNNATVTYAGSQSNGKVILAAYDVNGCTYATAKDIGASVDFTDFITNAGSYTKLKAFYVDSMTSLVPYCVPAEK